MDKLVTSVTDRIVRRSGKRRRAYLTRVDQARQRGPRRASLSCSNLAHGVAACAAGDKQRLGETAAHNIAIITAYNDMLSAHQPFERFPAILREAARQVGASAQVAGATPAMCDGVTQGQPGMELSLFSRDVIAQATAVGLSHDMYDAAVLLGICDKIIPGLLIGALTFGHLPMVFAPGGPMPSGLPNKKKAEVRNRFAAGKATRIELFAAESASYHSPGTCTFYGTANSNQMLMEIMGLHLPGSTFINPGDPLRDRLTAAAARKAVELAHDNDPAFCIGHMIDERAVVNAIIGLIATGGSTNHTIHLVAIARAAGITVDWQDFDDLSSKTPLLARVYPNGQADVNQFRDAGGVAFVIGELASAGLLHDDVSTICGTGLTAHYLNRPDPDSQNEIVYLPETSHSKDLTILRPAAEPFSLTGGIRLLTGNLGRSIIKVSAIPEHNRIIRAPAVICSSQKQLLKMLIEDGIDRDLVAVVRFQGVSANGMPELHKLTPALSVLQEKGRKVALITDGRMSGASGAVPAAIHLTPEAARQGPIGKLRDDDIINLDSVAGTLNVELDEQQLVARDSSQPDVDSNYGCGRELFASMRRFAGTPEQGATTFGDRAI